MLIQILIILFVLFALARIVSKFQKRELTGREFIFWSFFWLALGVVSLFIRKIDVWAQFLGVERAADLVTYLAIISIFYIIFRVFVKLEHIERNITKIVSEISFLKKEDEEISKNKPHK